MATETASSDHASATDELIVKKEKNEAIAEMIDSLANEDGEGKHDKPDDAQGEATPSSNKEGEAEGGEKETEIEEEKSNDSPAVETPAEDNGKHEEAEEAQTASVPSSNTEASDKKDEPDGIVEKSGDPVTLEENVAGDSKEEKEPTSEAQSIIAAEPEETPSVEPAEEETPQQPENEYTETEEEEQPKTADFPEPSAETIEKSRDAAVVEANAPIAEPEAEVVVKETEILEPSPEKEEKPEPEPEAEPMATEVQVKPEEQEKESEEKPHDEIEQPSSIEIPESSAEVKEEPSDAIEEKTREVSLEELKEINKDEAGSAETEKAEPVVTEVVENPKEPENQPLEQKEEDQTNTGAIPEPSAETIDDTTEEKTREPEPEKVEPVVNEQSSKQEKEEEPEKEEEIEPEPKTVISETVTESVEKPGDVVEVHPPKVSDTEVMKESGNSVSEVVPEKGEQQLEVCEKVEETSNDVDTDQGIVNETTTKIEGASDDTIKDSLSLKEEETSITENTPQVSSNGEAQASPEELLEPSHEATEKVIEKDEGNKESSFADVIEEAPKEVAVGEVKIPEQASTDEEAKTSIVEEREYSVPTGVEEKVDVAAASDEKKEPETATDAVSSDAEVEINKVEEKKETTTEATDTKVDEISAAVKEPVRETLASKFQQQEEESAAKTEVGNSEQRLEEPEKPEVEDVKESDAMKTTSRDLPKEASAKPAQKQSNNIISKVKQSLVKAKKAIIGKSPSSKNHSSDAKGDIKVN